MGVFLCLTTLSDMKRYIEIVYDNSGSMNGQVQGQTKYRLAQDLFEKVVLPTIARKDDEVVLRLLGDGCHQGFSKVISLTKKYGVDRSSMLNHLRSISHTGSTPLIYTISDAVDTCRLVKADEYCIFVLTDGDDTCGINIYDLIPKDIIDKYVRCFTVLVAALAVEDALSRNNITAIATAVGGQTVILDGHDSVKDMQAKLKTALTKSGFSKKLPLEHCFKSLPGFDMSWDDIQQKGIEFHQAEMLFQMDMLSWEPDFDKQVSQLEFAELWFLFSLYFKSDLPEEQVWAMLKQLRPPYYYSFDCIYWDFSAARWKYFREQPQFEQTHNPYAGEDERTKDRIADNFDMDRESYEIQPEVYRVEWSGHNMPRFILKPIGTSDYSYVLKPGDQIVFTSR